MIFLRIILGSRSGMSVFPQNLNEIVYTIHFNTAGFNGLITCKRYPCSVVWTSNCAWHQSPQRSDGLSRSICRRSLIEGILPVSILCWELQRADTACIRCSAINKMEWTWFVNYYTSLYTTVTLFTRGLICVLLKANWHRKHGKRFVSSSSLTCQMWLLTSIQNDIFD